MHSRKQLSIGTEKKLNPMNTLTNSIGMKLVYIPSGSFMMGSPENEAGQFYNEQLQHEVILSQAYHLGQTVVTQGKWEAVMGTQPWLEQDCVRDGDDYPAVYISWEDATKFCEKLSALPSERAAGRVYRLPTEAEWEYACRAGTTTAYSFGNSASGLSDYAWYEKNTYDLGDHAQKVGQKKANAWGLYDMHGNVWEWCMDWYGEYPRGSVTDPSGVSSGSPTVFRGGSWDCTTAENVRSACRLGGNPSIRFGNVGFRVTCVPSGQ